jgi:hypothetical protein
MGNLMDGWAEKGCATVIPAEIALKSACST